MGRPLQRLTREAMQTNAELGSVMNERFNVGGALLAKLYGRPRSGPSGAGKTTITHLVPRLYDPTRARFASAGRICAT